VGRKAVRVGNAPRPLSVDDLAELFEGRTRLVERLARHADPLGDTGALLREVPENELIEALNAHPRIGAPASATSATSAGEQGAEGDARALAELRELNALYEGRFGFRFVVFVNRRPRSEIVPILRARLARSRRDELETAVGELVAIARDRYHAGSAR
jgi:2-oxo-4-hydroxy-4-carboxy--5-ureidoimidazoline (OHCU) decarboxylase